MAAVQLTGSRAHILDCLQAAEGSLGGLFLSAMNGRKAVRTCHAPVGLIVPIARSVALNASVKSRRNIFDPGTSNLARRYRGVIRGKERNPMDYYVTMAACAGTGSFLIAALMALYG
ncbi:hypothetical protein [Rhizobium sp. BR 314]|uniref:hypothetical protein n=1 Tax=Rhizobium sp. BR 314 TaxID=3040013 RepID=UPI0039BF1670